MQEVISRNFPFYTFVDVDTEGRRGGDRRHARRPHHHAAGEGHRRQGAASHRRVRDEGQVARGLRGRREPQRARRDDEREARHARPRQAARRLRHRAAQGRRARLRPQLPRDDVHAVGSRQRALPAAARGRRRLALLGRPAAHRHELPCVLPHGAGDHAVLLVAHAAQGQAADGVGHLDRRALHAALDRQDG